MTDNLEQSSYRPELGFRLSPERARVEDASPIFDIRQQRERWMNERQIDQWEPGSRSLAWYEQSVARDDWFVVRDGDAVRAALRIGLREPGTWHEMDADAIYIHDLMVSPQSAGTRLGESLLTWAEELAVEHGINLARLDCMEENRGLVAYYERRGYRVVGRAATPYPHRGGWTWGALMEKSLV